MHVLFLCDFSRTVWQMAGVQSMNLILPGETAFDVLHRMTNGCSRDHGNSVGMYCWSI